MIILQTVKVTSIFSSRLFQAAIVFPMDTFLSWAEWWLLNTSKRFESLSIGESGGWSGDWSSSGAWENYWCWRRMGETRWRGSFHQSPRIIDKIKHNTTITQNFFKKFTHMIRMGEVEGVSGHPGGSNGYSRGHRSTPRQLKLKSKHLKGH